MNLSSLIEQYFPTAESEVTVVEFEGENVGDVHKHVINVLMQQTDIEMTVIKALEYCLYEVLDNVIIHSDSQQGIVLMHFNPSVNTLSILVADEGIGVKASLAKNEKYCTLSEQEALRLCIEDKVTDGEGMGFGLYATSLLDQKAGLLFEIRSGSHTMQIIDGVVSTRDSDFWQGAIVYMQLQTNKVINPQEVVEYRTDVEDEFDTLFLNDKEIEELW